MKYAILALLALPQLAQAAVLEVGPGRALASPSAAARLARDGDTIRIDPGTYYDCATWQANRLTILGTAPDVVISDSACGGKAAFVLTGRDTTIDRITFTRIRVADGNGAGIRAEGAGLTVTHSAFINNQTAILAVAQPEGIVVIRDSVFTANGACSEHGCVGALMLGRMARIEITGTEISGTKFGHQVTAGADTMVLKDCRIADGPQGSSSYLLALSDTSTLLVQGNSFEKGPNSANPGAAILLEGAGGEAVFRNNRFVNDTGAPTTFIRNWTSGDPVLEGNTVAGSDSDISSAGRLRHRATLFAIDAKDTLRHFAGDLRRLAGLALARARTSGLW